MAVRFRGRTSFTVVVTAGVYAVERLTLGQLASATLAEDPTGLDAVMAVLESAPAGAVVEIWVAKSGATGIDADYTLFQAGFTSGGQTVSLVGVVSVQIRVKSGGTAGTAIVSAAAR